MKWAVISIYVISIFTVHFRGRVRLPLFRQLFDHSSIVAPMNLFMYLFSGVPYTAYFPVSNFRGLELLEKNWELIRDEALNLQALEKIKSTQKNDDAGFNSFFKNGWKRFYLKWYDASHPSAEYYCPKTVALLRAIPCVKAAMFAELGPGGKLNEHR
ncbi:MAG: aspartyl/asparaginyl beta-hydroxylase domain-containing protein, partial [Candidatus Nitrotoga sp.]